MNILELIGDSEQCDVKVTVKPCRHNFSSGIARQQQSRKQKPLQQTKLPERSKLPAARHDNVALDDFTTPWIHLHSKTSPNDGQLSDS